MISLPTDSAVTICARCSGVAASGNAAIRLCMRPSQSARSHRGFAARRLRARNVSASRRRVRKAGESGGNTDPQEPILTLSFSDGREPQLVFYPTNQTSSTTLWGQGLPEDTWWHLAVVNDGKHTTMYVEGCPTVDVANQVNSKGITQLNLPWALGGYNYGGSINQIFYGWVGDVRIVNRALPVSQFMINS